LKSGSPNRYEASIFFGQTGNDPQLNNVANLCFLGIFPITPVPFTEFSAFNMCGDFSGNSTATLQVTGIKLLCAPAPGTNKVVVPYVAAWDNQIVNTCTPANLTAGTNSKCIGDAGNTASSSTINGLYAYGYVKITKATLPSYSTQSFSFTASSPATTMSTTAFSLSNG